MVSWDRPGKLGQTTLWVIMFILALIMLFPLVYVLAVSFSSYRDVVGGNLVIFPAHPTLEAYRWVLQGSGVVQGLEVSIFVAVVGTAVSMFLTTTMAYALSRKGVPGGKFVLWLVLLTMLITPSFITRYLVVKQLGMLDTLWALIIPSAIGPFNLIVLRQFFMGLPEELIDSARLDGANDLQILWRVVLPLSKAPLAAISLFYAVANWNSFFDATIYINNPQLYPVSVVLRMLVLQGQDVTGVNMPGVPPPPDITVQMAVVVLATLPILLVYPFLQKHFTKGVLTGSVKG
ncbi:carbohydrate ABC transporter permease [Ktedonosporobacter rubrisoli]|uniref:Carbohydrate ABC transporter permease n=1 Tax=Ktedonosporobacter rubrisoli TaxID=2509675 RepID=A0A4P6JV24_KTERU|nr:carbohydrate ABC transporter permease [Ktedonosporobacter rubrisoli]QBD79354.1 carbohydrate ABC transporter permease [Ktedonosporobacter rubrisoli]